MANPEIGLQLSRIKMLDALDRAFYDRIILFLAYFEIF